MMNNLKYILALYLLIGIMACSKKDNAEPEKNERDPNERPTEMTVHHFLFSAHAGASRSYKWKYKPFYTSNGHVDSLAIADDRFVTYKYFYNAKNQPIRLKIKDSSDPNSTYDVTFTYNAEGTQWLSRTSNGWEKENWANVKYNTKGQRISLDYYQLQGADSLIKGSRSFIYDDNGNLTTINVAEKQYNKTAK